jgi:hypothetical protein
MKNPKSPLTLPSIILAAAAALFSATGSVQAQDQTFSVGEKVLLEASGHWVPCTVVDLGSAESVMRVECEAYPKLSRAAGRYIVHDRSTSGIRRVGATASDSKASDKSAPSSSNSGSNSSNAASTATQDSGGSLKVGEYACYGTGGGSVKVDGGGFYTGGRSQILHNLGFKVLPGGRYTNLDGDEAGTYTISGGNVTFKGGHLGGQKGRDLKGNTFTIAEKAVCEPF